MKNFFLAVLIFISVVPSLIAEPFGFGIKGGIGFTNVGGDAFSPIGQNSQLGLSGGVFGDIGLSQAFSLQPEISIIGKGYSVAGVVTTSAGSPALGPKVNFSSNLTYLEIPLLLRVHGSLGPAVIINFVAGPYSAFLLNATDTAGTNSYDATSYRNSMDFGLIFGTGLEIGSFLLDLRYEFGFGPVGKYETQGEQNSALSLLVGFRLF